MMFIRNNKDKRRSASMKYQTYLELVQCKKKAYNRQTTRGKKRVNKPPESFSLSQNDTNFRTAGYLGSLLLGT
eukprot:gene10039-7014_t